MNKEIMNVYFQSNSNYTIRREQLNGVDHIVVPVTMMVEGVHSGSHGPILHLAEDLGRYPGSWDGIPITVRHPFVDGQYVSANIPEVLQDWAVGRVFHTQISGSALKAEAWIDESALLRVSDTLSEKIQNGEVIEVSIGIFSDEELVEGMWHTERYTAIAKNHRPNHLALLPDEVGACSIADGCGIRVNKQEKTKVATQKQVIVNVENPNEILKEINRIGFSINEMGFGEIRDKISSVVYGFDGAGLDNYLEEIYDNHFIYAQFNNRIEPRVRKLLKMSYSIDNSGNVQLSGEPVDVKREVSYTPVPQTNVMVKAERVIKKSKNGMCTDCVKKLADNLITNKSTAWNDADREYLEAQTEEQLEKMTPKQETQVNVETVSASPTREEILAVFSEKPMSNDEFLKLASPEVRLQINEGLELRTKQKKEMVTQIMANTEEWQEDELNLKELSELQKIYKLATKDLGESVFIANGGVGGATKIVNNTRTMPKTKVMLPPGVTIKQ